MERLIKSGKGWRIGWDRSAPKYQGLVGDDNWAIELSEAELNDFCRLLLNLAETMAQMSAELMSEERIAIEAETELLWMEVEGFPDDYCLRLILSGDRRCEAYWSRSAIKDLIVACQNLKTY
ncbi:MAG: DUF1818 family protein [Prochloraceae cyanobacterium]